MAPRKAAAKAVKTEPKHEPKQEPKEEPEEEPVHAVERIVSHRDKGRGKAAKREYLIKWEGFDDSKNTWEPEANLTQDLINDYNAEQEEGKAGAKKGAAGKAAAAKKPATRAAAAKAAAGAAKTTAAPVKTTSTKVTAPPKATKATPSKKRGLKGTLAPAMDGSLGVVDPASGITGQILNRDGDVFDIMLNLVDLSKNSDKYYLLQVISDRCGSFFTWARWGRTGTAGQSQLWEANDEDEAVQIFEDKYKEKTGCDWADHENFVLQPGMYKLLRTDHAAVAKKPPVVWQYHVTDGVNGKATGWYDYDAPASAIVERLHDEWMYNRELSQRLVESGDMGFTYNVDLTKMTQTNTSTGKIRNIRRMLTDFPAKGTSTAAAAPVASSSRKRGAAASAAAASTPPPAKKTKTATTASPPSRAAKTPVAATPASTSKVTKANVSVSAAAAASGSGQVDPACPLAGSADVEDDFDVMLNQVDISANKNKFYLMQLVSSGGQYYVWTRWGRVGEPGATQLKGPLDYSQGVKDFKGKFRDKTGNSFDDIDDFQPKPGKYELITMAAPEDIKPQIKTEPGSAVKAASKLDPSTQSLIQFIFSGDMFKDVMTSMEVDVKRMPLGRLSQAQVQRGIDVLEELEEEIQGRADPGQLQILSSKFYQVIPHSFSRNVRPTVIDNMHMVQQKYDLCNVLQDIEAAQEMADSAQGSSSGVVSSIDSKYAELKADLAAIKKGSEEFEMIEKYLENTMSTWSRKPAMLQHAWAVNRHGDDARFSVHDDLDNRKLLWHGTNVAVVAAILKSGLRIMPHSGGRVGRGIYMASESGKSFGYVCGARAPDGQQLGIMFLAEAALGREHSITRDDHRLTAAPPGFDSVVARGAQEPDPNDDKEIVLDGHPVVVPLGQPKPVPQYKGSSFANSEYLIYKESQHRIRYMLTVKM